MEEEVVQFCEPILASDKPICIVDATLGFGGHVSALLSKYLNYRHRKHVLFRGGVIHAVDADSYMIETAKRSLSKFSDFFNIFYHNCFFDEFFLDLEPNSADIILMDLGLSMFHFKHAARGFSFNEEHKLDMRLSTKLDLSAYEIVNTYNEEELTHIFYTNGEERQARKWARRIVSSRTLQTIESPKDLCTALQLGKKYSDKAILSRIFQAIRIEVNQEIDRLKNSLPLAWKGLKKDGILLVISFHSLEDRLMKQFSKHVSGLLKIDKVVPIFEKDCFAKGRNVTKKALTPSEDEVRENYASRSAKLRIVKKIV